MSTIHENQTTPRDVARMLFRHWRKITLIFCGIVGLALFVIALYPRSYASESKLVVRIGRESVGLDPTATTGDTVMLQKTQDEEVNSAVNIIMGREVLERVVEKIGADRILSNSPTDESTGEPSDGGLVDWVSNTLVSLRLSDPGTPMDRAVRRLESKTSVTAPKQSTVITVRYTAASPKLAHDVVETLTTVFLEEHSRMNQSDGSLQFFAEQADKLFKDLTVAQEKLRDRKNTYQLTSAQSRRSIVEQTNDAMRQKVYDLQMQETDLMSRYTDEYPPLKEIRRQRELAEKSLMNLPTVGTVADESAQPEGAHTAGSDRSRTKASPAVLQVTKFAADQQGRLKSELQALNDQELELAQLEREVKLLEGKYAMHVEKLEQARVNDALSRERISNVKVAQPASLVHKPVAPRKSVFLAGAFVLALIGGLGSAFAAETCDQTLRTTAQVERELGLPVLASIPRRKQGRKSGHAASSSSAARPTGNAALPEAPHRHAKYRGLATALRSAGGNGAGHAKTVGVVGCGTSQARSRVAGNLAVEAASSGTQPVLLIDADSRHRRVSKRFHLNGAPGWRDVLAGSAAKSCVQQSTPSNLDIMGPGRSNGAVAVGDASIKSVTPLDGIKSDYGFVVVDLPASGELEGFPMAGDWIDEAVLVVESERTRIQAAQRAKDLLQRAGVRVTGVVLANRRDYIPRWLYQRL